MLKLLQGLALNGSVGKDEASHHPLCKLSFNLVSQMGLGMEAPNKRALLVLSVSLRFIHQMYHRHDTIEVCSYPTPQTPHTQPDLPHDQLDSFPDRPALTDIRGSVKENEAHLSRSVLTQGHFGQSQGPVPAVVIMFQIGESLVIHHRIIYVTVIQPQTKSSLRF